MSNCKLIPPKFKGFNAILNYVLYFSTTELWRPNISGDHCEFKNQGLNQGLWVKSYEEVKTTPRNYGFLKRIKSADDVVSDAFWSSIKSFNQWLWNMFRWHSRDKMNELQEPQKIIICKLLMVNSCCAIRRCRRKVLFSHLKFINMHGSAQQWGSVIWQF